MAESTATIEETEVQLTEVQVEAEVDDSDLLVEDISIDGMCGVY
jgi:mycofactocin precursor